MAVPRRSERLEQREILHVARAHLEHVCRGGDQRHIFRAQDLGHDWQAALAAGGGKEAKPFPAQSLKRIRGRSRLERPAAQQARPGLRDGAGGRPHLLLRFDRARAGRDDEFLSPDFHGSDADARGLRAAVARHERVRRRRRSFRRRNPLFSQHGCLHPGDRGRRKRPTPSVSRKRAFESLCLRRL